MGWGGRCEEGSKGSGHMYTYGWFMLIFDRKQQNSKAIILQLKNYYIKIIEKDKWAMQRKRENSRMGKTRKSLQDY